MPSIPLEKRYITDHDVHLSGGAIGAIIAIIVIIIIVAVIVCAYRANATNRAWKSRQETTTYPRFDKWRPSEQSTTPNSVPVYPDYTYGDAYRPNNEHRHDGGPDTLPTYQEVVTGPKPTGMEAAHVAGGGGDAGAHGSGGTAAHSSS